MTHKRALQPLLFLVGCYGDDKGSGAKVLDAVRTSLHALAINDRLQLLCCHTDNTKQGRPVATDLVFDCRTGQAWPSSDGQDLAGAQLSISRIHCRVLLRPHVQCTAPNGRVHFWSLGASHSNFCARSPKPGLRRSLGCGGPADQVSHSSRSRTALSSRHRAVL